MRKAVQVLTGLLFYGLINGIAAIAWGYGLFLSVAVVIRGFGLLIGIVSILVAPITLVVAPIYGAIQFSNWSPLLVVYGGTLLLVITGSAGQSLMKRLETKADTNQPLSHAGGP